MSQPAPGKRPRNSPDNFAPASSSQPAGRGGPPGRLVVEITPAGAFAASALAVALLALAFSAGRCVGLVAAQKAEQFTAADAAAGVTLENVHLTPPLNFENISVDRGTP